MKSGVEKEWIREVGGRHGARSLSPKERQTRARSVRRRAPLSFYTFFFLCVRLFHPLKQEEERGKKGGSSTPRLDDPRFVPLHGTAVNRSRHKLLGEEKKMARGYLSFFPRRDRWPLSVRDESFSRPPDASFVARESSSLQEKLVRVWNKLRIYLQSDNIVNKRSWKIVVGMPSKVSGVVAIAKEAKQTASSWPLGHDG